MNKHTVKQLPAGLRAVPAASLHSRFAAYRRTVMAVASIASLKTAATLDARDADRRLRAIVSERAAGMNDSTADTDAFTLSSALAAAEETAPSAHGLSLGGDLLTPSERAALSSLRPGSRSVVFRAAPVASVEPSDLPPGFVAPVVPEYVPLSPAFDSETEAEAAREAAAEIAAIEADETRERIAFAAVSFDSQPFAGIPTDYSPHGSDNARPVRVAPAPIIRAPAASRLVTPPRAAVTVAAAGSSDSALLAAVLNRAAKRRA